MLPHRSRTLGAASAIAGLVGGPAALAANATTRAATRPAAAHVYVVVPFHSIGGVGFGQTLAQVEQRIGKPYKIDNAGPHETALWVSWQITFRHGVTRFVDANGPQLRFPHGIRSGASRAAVAAAYPGGTTEKFGDHDYTLRRVDTEMSFMFYKGRLSGVGIYA